MNQQSVSQAARNTILLAVMSASLPYISAQTEIYFSPDDGIEKHLISQLNAAKSYIHAAVFMLTSSNVLDALRAAKKRGVDVQIVTDQGCIESPYSRISTLTEDGIELFVYSDNKQSKEQPLEETVELLGAPADQTRNRYRSLMHHKFVLIDHIIWTGSFNWTKTANSSNQENAIKMDDPVVHKRFWEQFEILKTRCASYRDFELIPFDLSDEIDHMGLVDRLAYYAQQIFETIFW